MTIGDEAKVTMEQIRELVLGKLLDANQTLIVAESPVDTLITDHNGRRIGFANGVEINEIPNAEMRMIQDVEIFLVPSNANYEVESVGTGSGTFNLYCTIIKGEGTFEDVAFTEVSVNKGSITTVKIGEDIEEYQMEVDANGDGEFEQVIVGDTGQAVTPEDKYPTTWGDVKQTKLFQNYPNPFNPDTWIPYQLERESNVTIKIYDVSGQLVRILDLGRKRLGVYIPKSDAAYWDGKDNSGETVASGIYFYQMTTSDFQSIKKMTLSR